MTEKQKEYYKQYRKKYYQDHKEYFKEKTNEWRKNNPERKKELVKYHRNKRAAQLIQEGVLNPWSVIVHGYEPKYEREQDGR